MFVITAKAVVDCMNDTAIQLGKKYSQIFITGSYEYLQNDVSGLVYASSSNPEFVFCCCLTAGDLIFPTVMNWMSTYDELLCAVEL